MSSWLEGKAQGEDLYLILGNDWIPRFHEWKDYESLLEIVHFVVMRRNGKDSQAENPHLSTGAKEAFARAVVDVPSIPVSSSDIRKNIQNNTFLKKHLPGPVLEYIRKNNLYQPANQNDQ